MKKLNFSPTTVRETIRVIDKFGKRDEFIKDYGMTPEEYFSDSDIRKYLQVAIDEVLSLYRILA